MWSFGNADQSVDLYVYSHGDCASLSWGGVQGNFMAGECCKGSGHSSLCGVQFEYRRLTLEDSLKSSILMVSYTLGPFLTVTYDPNTAWRAQTIACCRYLPGKLDIGCHCVYCYSSGGRGPSRIQLRTYHEGTEKNSRSSIMP